ncbi:MAG: hypothetical protein ABI134_12735 [Byssovorax sp.]
MKLVSTVLVLAGAVVATGFATGCDDGGAGTGGSGGEAAGPTTTTGSTNPATTTTGTTNPTTTTTTTGGGGEGLACPDSYCKLDTFAGYGFVYSDMKDGGASTITQKGTSLCASGVAGAVVGMAYDKFWGAGIGVNLNQAMMAMAPIEAAQLTGTGVTVGISNPPKTEIRVVVDEGGLEYCAVLTGASTTVKWTDFNTTCWDKTLPTAKALAAAPLSKAIKVQVITGDADRPFDYCISSIVFK